MTELDDEKNPVNSPATIAKLRPSPEDCRPLVYRAEAPQLGVLNSSITKMRKRRGP